MDGADTEKFKGSTYLLIENYGNVLDKYLPDELKNPNMVPRVFSVACGFGLELKGLTRVLPNAHIEAIDSSEEAILGARRFNPGFSQDRIRLADASKKESFGDEDWDLIVVRNPKVGMSLSESKGVWVEILQNCFDKLKPNGFLYLTTLSIQEMQEILGFFSQLPIEDVTPRNMNRTHMIYPPIEGSFPLIEKYIAILKKTEVGSEAEKATIIT